MIPATALASAAAIIGRAGSGKTFAAKSAVERELAAGARVCIIDPTGAWWGLRARADGAPSVFAPVIFGGDHADVPIGDGSGERLGGLIAAGKVRASIVDVSNFTSGEATRFLTGFMEELYRSNRAPLLLVMDEADAMAPQQPMPEQQRLKGAVNKIVRRGRIKGLRPLMITQRPAVIDKSVLSQISTMVAMRLTSPQDRKAVEEWVKGNADAAQAREVVDSLPKLAVGEGWIWSPADDVLERVTFPQITTFDSSRAPEEGDAPTRPSALADVDLRELREAFLSTAGSPPSLKRGVIAEAAAEKSGQALSVSLRDGAGSQVEPDQLAAAEARGYERGLKLGRIEGFQSGKDHVAIQAITCLQLLAGVRYEDRDSLPAALTPRAGSEGFVLPAAPEAPRPPVVASPERAPKRSVTLATKTEASGQGGGRDFNSAARKLLTVLDTNPPVRRTWQQAASLAGLRASGGHYNAGRKALRDAGLVIEEGDLVRIAAPSADAQAAVTDPAALVETWCRVLKGAAPKLLGALFHSDGRAARTAIAQELGMKPTGGHWNAGWKELRDNGIVTVSGDHAELTELFKGKPG